MIDGFKSYDPGLKGSDLFANPLLSFRSLVDLHTGEVIPKKRFSKYNGIYFIVNETNRVQLKGSLHMYANKGKHNYDDYTYARLVDTLHDLWCRFGINPFATTLNNLEFGINLELQYPPKRFIDSLLSYKGNEFRNMPVEVIGVKGEGREVAMSQFIIKIYSKSDHLTLSNYILRIEVRVRKMEFINSIGVKKLSDLLDINKLEGLKLKFKNILEHVIFTDDDIDVSELTKPQIKLYRECINPREWTRLMREQPTNYPKKRKKFKRIIELKGPNRYHEVLTQAVAKWDKLCVADEKTVQKMTDLIENTGNPIPCRNGKTVQKMTGSFIQKNPENDTLYTQKLYGNNNRRYCLVTGLDISMQKETSKFLSKTGLKWLLHHQPEQYQNLNVKFLPRSGVSGTHTKYESDEISHLAKQIRNRYYNSRPIQNATKHQLTLF